ncbi:hypothetical protein A0256_22810 [Mucilaginibacter sp. PAMC 26640]|nr:hypothetical protein A0256_22810 [Mucilaginibacter sp. PAMC 26640]
MIILITGGASGLGAAITTRMARSAEFKVYFTYNQSVAKAKAIEGAFPNTSGIRCDFSDQESVDSLKLQIAAINPDVLINNAYSGSFLKTHFHKTQPADFLAEFKDSVLPTLAVTQAAISSFRKKKAGKIITVLTAALVNTPPAGAAIYVANKAYLQQMAKVWAAENGRFNITSNTVSPNFMQTKFTGDIDERMVEQIRQNHPLKTLLTTEEVAETIYFLANTTAQVNGIDILINAATNIK